MRDGKHNDNAAEVINLRPYVIEKAQLNYELIGGSMIPADRIERKGDVILKSVLQKTGLYESRRTLFQNWPNLETASVRLCELLSPEFPGKGRPLLEETLLNAFGAFEESRKAREPDMTRMLRYLHALSASADDVLSVCAFTFSSKGEAITWPPFSEPLAQWLRRVEGQEIAFTRNGQPTLDMLAGGRAYLSSKIMSIPDAGRLALFNRVEEAAE